jgi:CRISPR-associated protein (TIGR02584 family)
VTETLYALAVAGHPKILPQRVCIITTGDAYGGVVSSLLGRGGAISRLKQEHDLPPSSLKCGIDDIHLIRSGSGRILEDIRSSEDSRAAGESIAGVIKRLHAVPGAELHCSIAGGRKTMGALLALALQLAGKPGDRLYHVLVNEPFEHVPDFFYPPSVRRFYSHAGKRIDSGMARIDLAEIPLVRLGTVAESLGLAEADLAKRAERIEEAMQEGIRPVYLSLDTLRRTVRINEAEMRLPPQEFALYALYARLRAKCSRCSRLNHRGCPDCWSTDSELLERHRKTLLDFYLESSTGAGAKLVKRLSDVSGSGHVRMDLDDWLRQTRSRLLRLLRNMDYLNIGSCLISAARIAGDESAKRRGLSVSPERIRFPNVGRKKKDVDNDLGCHAVPVK